MEENYIFSLIAVFLFGLVFLKKETPLSLDQKVKNNLSDRKRKSSNQTAVDKYLQDKKEEFPQNEVSGVARYLADKKIDSPGSGVDKYLAQQTVSENKIAKENASSVEKYLNNRD